MMPAWIILIRVNTHDHGDVRITGRSGNDDFTGSGGQMFGSAFTVAKQSGAFRNNINPQFAPVDFIGLFDGPDGNRIAIILQLIILRGNICLEPAVYRIIFK